MKKMEHFFKHAFLEIDVIIWSKLSDGKRGSQIFWQNKILEGNCRGGQILKLAITSLK